MKKLTLHLSLLLVSSIFLTSCGKEEFCMNGNHNLQTKNISVSNFNSIESNGAFNVQIRQGSDYKVTVTGDENILPDFEVRIINDLCILELKNGCYKNYSINVDITMPNIESAHLNGSGKIELNDFKNQNVLKTEINGSGNITIQKFESATDFFFKVNGSGYIQCKDAIDAVNFVEAIVNGSGNINAMNVTALEAEAMVAGSGIIKITALNTLEATIDGSGVIQYQGEPTVTKKIIGSGTITRIP